MKEMECIFCKIVKKEINAKTIYEDDDVLAFRDINPQAPVHVLIIPKRHIPSLNEISDEDTQILGKIQKVAKEIAERENISRTGYRIVLNAGRDAGQAVFHVHYHLLGGRVFSWPPG